MSKHCLSGFASAGEPHADYAGSLYEYSHRKLSYDSDILNAFAGISNILFKRIEDNSTKEISSVYGLPVNEFDWALLWQANKTAHRRSGGWPSWSWCGWSGGVYMLLSDLKYSDLQDWLSNHTWIDWITYSVDGRPQTCIPSDCVYQRSETRWPPLTHPPIVKAQPHDVLSTERSYIANAQDALRLQSQLVYDQAGCLPLLHFASLSAKFYLQVTDDLTNDDEPIDRSYKICDSTRTPCGCIWISKLWIHRPDEAYDFIVLSDARSKDMKMFALPAIDSEREWGAYHVMLVDLVSGGNVVERVAVGYVYQEALDRAIEPGVKWKEVWLR